MRAATAVGGAFLCFSIVQAQDIVVQKLHGDVQVRHGVSETWSTIAVGDVLRPDDTMRTGGKATATLVLRKSKRIVLPPNAMVDASDLRHLSPEELMLKLTMERVRASSYEWKTREMNIPNATAVHGASKQESGPLAENDPEIGRLQMNGARVLFNNGFFPTCALKAMDVLRRYPTLRSSFDNCVLVAESLEHANLRGEALNEYVVLSRSDVLTASQLERVQAKISMLRHQSGQ